MATNSPQDTLNDRQTDSSPNNTINKPVIAPIPESPKIEIKKDELILCDHCGRTATNGIKCQGICVADSGY